jgi:hypothetical protein
VQQQSGVAPRSANIKTPAVNPFASSPAVVVPPNTTNINTSTAGSMNTEERVQEFYRQHNPAKLSSVPEILEKYRGREQELLQKLQKQYGVSK